MIIVEDSAQNDRKSTTDKYQETEAEKSKQGHTVKDVYHSHEPGSDLDETDIANTDEIDLREASSKDEVNLTILAKDKDNNAKKSDLVSNKDTEKTSGNSTRLELGINQPVGKALSENRYKTGIETVTKSGCGEHASSEMKYSPQEAYELLSTASETEAVRTHRSNLQMSKSADT